MQGLRIVISDYRRQHRMPMFNGQKITFKRIRPNSGARKDTDFTGQKLPVERMTS